MDLTIFGIRGTFTGWVDNPLQIWNGSTLLAGGAYESQQESSSDTVNTLWVYSSSKEHWCWYRQIFGTFGQYNTIKLSWHGQWIVSTRAAQTVTIKVSDSGSMDDWYISGGTTYEFGKSYNGHYNGTFEESVSLGGKKYFNIDVYSKRGWCWINWIQLWK